MYEKMLLIRYFDSLFLLFPPKKKNIIKYSFFFSVVWQFVFICAYPMFNVVIHLPFEYVHGIMFKCGYATCSFDYYALCSQHPAKKKPNQPNVLLKIIVNLSRNKRSKKNEYDENNEDEEKIEEEEEKI